MATDVQSRSITFTWEPPPTNLPIVGYTVNCTSVGGVLRLEQTSVLTAMVRDLQPFTRYNCTVFTRVNGNRGDSVGNIIRMTDEEGRTKHNTTYSYRNKHIELNGSVEISLLQDTCCNCLAFSNLFLQGYIQKYKIP